MTLPPVPECYSSRVRWVFVSRCKRVWINLDLKTSSLLCAYLWLNAKVWNLSDSLLYLPIRFQSRHRVLLTSNVGEMLDLWGGCSHVGSNMETRCSCHFIGQVGGVRPCSFFTTLRNPVQMNKNSKLGKQHSFEMCTAKTSKITEYKNYTLSDKTELQVAQMTALLRYYGHKGHSSLTRMKKEKKFSF